MNDNVHRLPTPPRSAFQVQSELHRDLAEATSAAYEMGYAVGRFDGYKAAAALAGPVLLVGVGIGCIIAVVVGGSL